MSSIRAFVRKVSAFPRDFRHWGKSTGWSAALTWTSYRAKVALGFPPPAILKMKPRTAMHPVCARLGNSSDMDVFDQVFRFQEYSCVREIPSPHFILDLGANVGYSSAYFLSCFPSAKLVAVEPDPGSFDLCRQNLAPYGERAHAVLGAVWSRASVLTLCRGAFRDGREWATQVRESQESDGANVKSWDIRGLLELAGETRIDLLKVDIERSELELFRAGASAWLPQVRNICIELHGPDCEDAFFSALNDFDYELGRWGELTVCCNLRSKSDIRS